MTAGGNGTLGPLVFFYTLCLFYLLPVVILHKYIGGWAWPAGILFWVLAAVIIRLAARHCGRNKS